MHADKASRVIGVEWGCPGMVPWERMQCAQIIGVQGDPAVGTGVESDVGEGLGQEWVGHVDKGKEPDLPKQKIHDWG